MINQLLNRLHRVFNKDPEAAQIIALAVPNGTVEIKDGTLSIIATDKAMTIALAGKTVAGLVSEINAIWAGGPYFDEPGYVDPDYLDAQELLL